MDFIESFQTAYVYQYFITFWRIKTDKDRGQIKTVQRESYELNNTAYDFGVLKIYLLVQVSCQYHY